MSRGQFSQDLEAHVVARSRIFASGIAKSDDEIVAATLKELEKLFPTHFGGETPAKLIKFHVVKTPRSVYEATPGRQQHRPSQVTPIDNFYLTGDFTMQPYLASMEGAVLSGKLTAQAIANAHSPANAAATATQSIDSPLATNAATA